jgi:hypothetical protein
VAKNAVCVLTGQCPFLLPSSSGELICVGGRVKAAVLAHDFR